MINKIEQQQTTKFCKMIGIKLRYYQPNKNKNNNKDCSIRTIAKLLNITWEESAKLLFEESLKTGLMMHHIMNISGVLNKYGYIKAKLSKYETISNFIMNNRNKRFAIMSDGHIVACINSTIYDTNFLYYDKFICGKPECILIKK